MKIGITYDLKAPLSPDLPDDFQEEFDSPVTIEAIAQVLRALGHEVVLLGDGRTMVERVLVDPPDLVFNFAEGQGVSRSREARVPALLEMLDIPYTGSDPLTLAVTLDKDVAKKLVAAAGVAVARGVVLSENEKLKIDNGELRIVNCEEGHGTLSSLPSMANVQFSIINSHFPDLTFPLIVKPSWEGSSKGIRNRCLVHRAEDLPEVVAALRRDHRQPILVEEFIDGDELTVGIYGNDPPSVLGIMRIAPQFQVDKFIYSLEVKRDYKQQVRYECPAPLPPEVYQAVERAALSAYGALGCRDIARIDFRLKHGVPYFLEVNPLPGLNPEDSDLVIMGRLIGWSHARLVETIVEAALRRQALLAV